MAIDPSSGSSLHEFLYEHVQVKGQNDHQVKTVFPNGEAYTSTWASHPITLLLPGEPEARTLCLTVHHEILQGERDTPSHFDELALSSNSLIMAFDPSSGAPLAPCACRKAVNLSIDWMRRCY